MSSAVEPDCNKNTVGLFAKLHQESTLQASWPSFQAPKADATATTVSKETTTAFSSFKKPFEAIRVSDLVEGDRCQAPAFRQVVDFVDGNYSACNVSEPLQADGPSTPMRYLPRTKYVCAETPENVYSLSFSLATGSSCLVDKEVEWVEKRTESITACSSKGLMYPLHPMKLNHPASTLKNSYRTIMSKVKQEGPEFHNENMVSVSLAKSERVKQLVQTSNSSYIQTFGSLGMTKTSISEGIDVQCQDVCEHMPSQMHVSPACTKVYIEDSQPSFRSLPRIVGFAECPPLHLKTEQQIIYSGNQQEMKSTGSADITCRSASGEPCAPWQPVTHTFGVLQCENTFQGSATSLQYNDPELIVSTPVCATNKLSTGNSTLHHMSILQIPLKSNDDSHGPTNEGNLHFKNNSMSGKKRKSRSCKMQQEADSAGCLTQETDCSLKAREKPESMTEETECFLKTREQTEDHQNCLLDKERFSQTKRQGERINCQNQNYISQDPMKKHIIFTGGVEECLPGSKTVQLPTLGSQCQSLGLKPLTFPAHSPMPAALSTFSSGGPSLPQLMVHTGKLGDSALGGKTISQEKKPCQRMTSPETDWGKFLALSATSDATAQVDQSMKETLVPYQQRFTKLQSFLKRCDGPDEEYLQAVRSLSATARSRHAVELETRAIMLSLEEAKELQRMKMLNVFGKDFQNSANDSGSTPQGPRLPAPGSEKTLKLVS